MKNISFSIKRKLQVKNRINIQIQKFPTKEMKTKMFINKKKIYINKIINKIKIVFNK